MNSSAGSARRGGTAVASSGTTAIGSSSQSSTATVTACRPTVVVVNSTPSCGPARRATKTAAPDGVSRTIQRGTYHQCSRRWIAVSISSRAGGYLRTSWSSAPVHVQSPERSADTVTSTGSVVGAQPFSAMRESEKTSVAARAVASRRASTVSENGSAATTPPSITSGTIDVAPSVPSADRHPSSARAARRATAAASGAAPPLVVTSSPRGISPADLPHPPRLEWAAARRKIDKAATRA